MIEMEEYKPKLYAVMQDGHESYLKGFLKQVPLTRDSLKHSDVFVLDIGCKVYVWVGEESAEFPRINGTMYATKENKKRGNGREELRYEVDDGFWQALDSCTDVIAFSDRTNSMMDLSGRRRLLSDVQVPRRGTW